MLSWAAFYIWSTWPELALGQGTTWGISLHFSHPTSFQLMPAMSLMKKRNAGTNTSTDKKQEYKHKYKHKYNHLGH